MSHDFTVRSGRRTSHVQRSESAPSIFSGILKSYLVEFFACALLAISQPVIGDPDVAGIVRSDGNTLEPAFGNSSTAKLCKPGCVTLIDYLSGTTHLEFSRTYNAARPARAELPARWRHRYDIRLTRRDDDRIVFDHHGIRHLFVSNHDGTYSPADSTSGTLILQGDQHIWIDSHAIQHEFYGSFLTTLRFPDNQKLILHYKTGQLHSVTDEESSTIIFLHDNGYLSKVQLPDGRAVRYNSDPCNTLPQPTTDPLPDDSPPTDSGDEDPLTEAPPERCDTQENPVPGFDAIDARSGVSTLDARPASCQSYFVEFYGTVRGEEIEHGLEDHPPYSAMVPTNRSFPVIDFINGNELIVVRSRDVASATYNNPDSPDALHDRLMRDGLQIQTRLLDRLESEGFLSGTENGQTTLITHGEQQRVALHLLIRQGMASAAHWQQIANARIALAARYGIDLQVIIIP